MNDFSGKIFTGSNSYQAITTATTTTCYTPSTGKKVVVMGYAISVTAADVVTFELNSVVFAKFDFAANGGANITGEFPIAIGAADAVLQVITSANTNCYVSFWGREI